METDNRALVIAFTSLVHTQSILATVTKAFQWNQKGVLFEAVFLSCFSLFGEFQISVYILNHKWKKEKPWL